jgi:hypothetical protein
MKEDPSSPTSHSHDASVTQALEVVPCAQCGVHVPVTQAVQAPGPQEKWFCSAHHPRLYQANQSTQGADRPPS